MFQSQMALKDLLNHFSCGEIQDNLIKARNRRKCDHEMIDVFSDVKQRNEDDQMTLLIIYTE